MSFSAKGTAAAARWGFSLLLCTAALCAAAPGRAEGAPACGALAARVCYGGVAGVLVSFSVPEESLRRLAEDAARAGIPLYLNGLADGSARATAQRILRVDPNGKSRWSVDPRLFDMLRVKAVPVLVIEHEEGFAVLAGDVRLSYSLGRIARRGGRAGDRARELLEAMGARP